MIEYNHIKWYKHHGGLLPRVSPHREIHITREESRKLLRLSNAYFIRYTNEWDKRDGEFWYVIKEHYGGMDELSKKMRNQVRKGFNNCFVKRVEKEEIAYNGYDVYVESWKTHHPNTSPMEKSIYIEYVLNSGYQYWAVYLNKSDEEQTIIAYACTVIQDNICRYVTINFHPDYLKLYPGYALIFQMNQYYLNQQHCLYVTDGARSMLHDTNIQNFLIQKFKFRKAFCRLNVIYRWDVGLMVSVLYPFRRIIRNIHNPIVRKLASLLNQESVSRGSSD